MAKAVEVASGTSDVAIDTAGVRNLLGVNITEDAASTAEVVIRSGTVAGAKLFRAKLASGETLTEWFGPQGVIAGDGLFCERVSGTTTVIAYTD